MLCACFALTLTSFQEASHFNCLSNNAALALSLFTNIVRRFVSYYHKMLIWLPSYCSWAVVSSVLAKSAEVVGKSNRKTSLLIPSARLSLNKWLSRLLIYNIIFCCCGNYCFYIVRRYQVLLLAIAIAIAINCKFQTLIALCIKPLSTIVQTCAYNYN